MVVYLAAIFAKVYFYSYFKPFFNFSIMAFFIVAFFL